MPEPMDHPMAEQFDNEWGNSKQTSLHQRWSIHQPHNVGAPIKASLAAADWLKRSSVAPRVRYAGCIPADEPLVLIRRTFGLFRGTPQRYPSSCICIQGPQACSARWALNNNDRYPPTFSCTPSSQYISTHQEASL